MHTKLYWGNNAIVKSENSTQKDLSVAKADKSIQSNQEGAWRTIIKEDYSPQASVSLLWG